MSYFPTGVRPRPPVDQSSQGWSATTGAGLRPPLIVQTDHTGRAVVGGGTPSANIRDGIRPMPRPAVAMIPNPPAASAADRIYGSVQGYGGPSPARAFPQNGNPNRW